jgi:flagellar hook assembly protein FlgD
VPKRDDASRVVVGIYDLDGRRVADLGSSTSLPSTFVWDGRDAAGRIVSAETYVLACEWFSASTGLRRVEKVVVGCGRKHDYESEH